MISYTLLLIASVVPLWQIIVVAVLAAAVVALGITDTVLLIKNKKAEQPSQAAEQQTAEQVPQPTAAEQPLPQPPITETEDFDEEESVAAIPMMVDGKQVYVRYVFSFSAKLIQSPQEVQQHYGEIMDEVNAYVKVKTSVSWRQLRIYQGRKTLAVMLFKGRKLCMAFALNPKDYEETKYRGMDLSEVKRFEKTPMLLKLTSPRKVKYAKYLFEQVALANGLEKGEVTATEFSLPYRETEQLVAEGLVRKFVSGDVEGTEEVQADISELIRASAAAQPQTGEDDAQAQTAPDKMAEAAEPDTEAEAAPEADEERAQPSAEVAEPEQPAEQPDEDEDAEDSEDADDFDKEDDSADYGATATVVDGKQVYVRYVFSFSAKLIQSPQEVQQRYGEIMDEVNAYAKVKTSVSWRQLRIYQGRKTLAVMLFKGRKLCMAFALNPKDYEESKYRGMDLSEVKRFEKTPMLLKLTSPRKVKYAKYLFEQVALTNGLEKGEVTATEFALPYRETEQLVAEGLVRKFVSGDVDGAEEVQVDISELIRSSITVNEAHVAISDSEAEKLVEKATPHDDAPEVAAAAAPAVYGNKRGIVNIDTLSAHFDAGDEVTLAQLIQKGLVQKKRRQAQSACARHAGQTPYRLCRRLLYRRSKNDRAHRRQSRQDGLIFHYRLQKSLPQYTNKTTFGGNLPRKTTKGTLEKASLFVCDSGIKNVFGGAPCPFQSQSRCR